MAGAQVIHLKDTDQFYSRTNGRLHWGRREQAQVFINPRIAQGALDLVARRGIDVQLMPSETPRQIEQAELFRKYLRLAQQAAVRCARGSGNWQEAGDEATSYLGILITEQWENYDKTRSQPTTWVYRSVYWYFQARDGKGRARKTFPLSEDLKGRPNLYDQIEPDVSDDAKFVLDMIREDPDRMVKQFKVNRTPRLFQEYLVIEKDWSWKRVFKVWDEIKEFIVMDKKLLDARPKSEFVLENPKKRKGGF